MHQKPVSAAKGNGAARGIEKPKAVNGGAYLEVRFDNHSYHAQAASSPIANGNTVPRHLKHNTLTYLTFGNTLCRYSFSSSLPIGCYMYRVAR